jgi:hypothetical protein
MKHCTLYTKPSIFVPLIALLQLTKQVDEIVTVGLDSLQPNPIVRFISTIQGIELVFYTSPNTPNFSLRAICKNIPNFNNRKFVFLGFSHPQLSRQRKLTARDVIRAALA